MIRFTSRVNVVFKMRKIHECLTFLYIIYIYILNFRIIIYFTLIQKMLNLILTKRYFQFFKKIET